MEEETECVMRSTENAWHDISPNIDEGVRIEATLLLLLQGVRVDPAAWFRSTLIRLGLLHLGLLQLGLLSLHLGVGKC